jgi:hypothetical protein
MDTTWFAVDRDGHVAAFESAEGGAVPENALNDQQGTVDPFAEIAPHAPSCEPIYTLEEHRSPLTKVRHVRPRKPYRRQPANPGFLRRLMAIFKGTSAPPAAAPAESNVAEELVAPVLMFLADPQTAASAAASGNGLRVKSLVDHAVLFKSLPLELYRSIHDQGACLGCHYLFEVFGYDEFAPPQYSKSGLYHYSCCEDQFAAPYGRHTIPEIPLSIDQLPAELRDKLAKVQFTNLSFAQTPYIQPAGRTKSYCWDGGYLTEDFKTVKANPGQEAEYKECYQNMASEEYFSDFTFEPPNS